MWAWCRKSAAASTAASSAAGFPSISASGKRRSAVWLRNQASPRMQAFLVLVMRSPSACSSMSSHTQPQKVQVAFLTTVRLIFFFLDRFFRHPNRTAGRRFSPTLGRESCPECAAAYIGRYPPTPREEPTRPRREVEKGSLHSPDQPSSEIS